MRNKFTKGKIFLSVAITLTVLLVNYLAGNTSIPFPDEVNILQIWDKAKFLRGTRTDSIPDDVMLVNISYDKMLVDYYSMKNENMFEGQQVITDRKKLLDFLTKAKEADNYKYIFLDVLFEKGLESNYDSLLFNTICGMDRIVIPIHKGVELQDSCLYAKAANSDYTTTWAETDFARFQYIHHGTKSAPLRMYEDINKGDIVRKGLFFFGNDGMLCRNGVTLKMPITISGNTVVEEDKERLLVYNLGADLLSLDSISPIADELDGKIVVIGDFVNDIHVTYAGKQPGSIICLNAYYSLVRGDHFIFGKYISTYLFWFFVALLYFGLSMIYLNGSSVGTSIKQCLDVSFVVIKKHLKSFLGVVSKVFPGIVTIKEHLKSFVGTKKKYLDSWRWFVTIVFCIACSIISVNILFWLIAAIAYDAFDIVYNIWIPKYIFTRLDSIVSIYNIYRNEKKTNNNSSIVVADCDNGGENL